MLSHYHESVALHRERAFSRVGLKSQLRTTCFGLALLRALNRVFTLIFEVPVADRAQLRRAQSRLHFGSSLCAFGDRDRGKLLDKVDAARTPIDGRNADR